MKQYRLLEIATQYDEYLRRFYRTHSDIEELSYDELFELLMADSHACANHLQIQLNNLGVESRVIFHNNRNLQDKWNAGHHCQSYFEILIAQIKEYSPDVILVSDMFSLDPMEIKTIKECITNKKVKLMGFHFSLIDDRIRQVVSLYDQIYTGSNGFVNCFKKMGIPALCLRHAFEPTIIDKMCAGERENQAVFCGSIMLGKNMHNNRLDMLEALQRAGIPHSFYGDIYGDAQLGMSPEERRYREIVEVVKKYQKQGLFGLEYYKCINQYNLCLNIHVAALNDNIIAGNMRMFEATGLGVCLLTDYRKENAELFEEGKEIVVYKSFDEMVEKAKWILDNPQKAREIALAGQKRTLEQYTYKNKAEQLNEYIQMILD